MFTMSKNGLKAKILLEGFDMLISSHLTIEVSTYVVCIEVQVARLWDADPVHTTTWQFRLRVWYLGLGFTILDSRFRIWSLQNTFDEPKNIP